MQPVVRQMSATLLTISACLLGFITPASAQGVRVEVTDEVTNGRITGWEHNLTERDPNLSHWHWEPISASSHSRNVKRFVDPNATAQEPQEYVRSHYIKPIKVALPVVHPIAAAHCNSSNSSSSDLNGKLLKKNQSQAVIAQSKAVSTYADYAKGATSSYGSGVKTQVAGNLLHVSGRRASCNPTATY